MTSSSGSRLSRSLGLTHAVPYGLGITIGAGIYVLVGLAAGRAGAHAPLAFVIAAAVMALSAASFAELGTRMRRGGTRRAAETVPPAACPRAPQERAR